MHFVVYFFSPFCATPMCVVLEMQKEYACLNRILFAWCFPDEFLCSWHIDKKEYWYIIISRMHFGYLINVHIYMVGKGDTNEPKAVADCIGGVCYIKLRNK